MARNIIATAETRDCVNDESVKVKCYEEHTCLGMLYTVTVETERHDEGGSFWAKKFDTADAAIAYFNYATSIDWEW
jgi:hypothetical protein